MRIPFNLCLTQKLHYPIQSDRTVVQKKIRIKDQNRWFMAVENGTQYFVCVTVKTWTDREFSFKLELERSSSDTGKNIELRVDVWDAFKFTVPSYKRYEESLKSGETTVCLIEDFILGIAEGTNALRLDGEIYLFELNAIYSSKELDQRLTSCSVESENGRKTDETLTALNKLSEDFRKFLDDKTTTDVALKCGSEILHAHKLILSARSPVFQAMFKNEMIENHTGIVNIDDISAQTLHTLLCYIYSGKFEKFTIQTACEGLYASEKYQLPEMKLSCIAFLKCSVSNDVALSMLKYADLYDEELKEYIIDYICRNFPAIQSSESWNNFEKENPTKANVVLKKVIKFLQK